MWGATYYWLIDDAKELFIGEIAIRHRLNKELELCGGHIGYGIRYSMQNMGYGSLMLKMALLKAKELGLTKILITCDSSNLKSKRVMEKNGFIYKDKVFIDDRDILKYWREL